MENNKKSFYLYLLVGVIIILVIASISFANKQGENGLNENSLSPNEILTIATSSEDLINNQKTNNNKMNSIITLKTNQGEIQFETYNSDAPNTVANFIKLANQGFYDGLSFHRVINGFMIQGGDPNCSPESSKIPATGPCGTGGPGYQFADELNPNTPSYQAGYKKGVVAMANSGPNTNGSQFFIMLEDNRLPNDYTIFGKIIKGQDIVDKIGDVATDANDRPTKQVVIEKVTVQE